MASHKFGVPSLDSVPRDFLPLEDTNHFPNNDILKEPKKAFSPEDGSRGVHQSGPLPVVLA